MCTPMFSALSQKARPAKDISVKGRDTILKQEAAREDAHGSTTTNLTFVSEHAIANDKALYAIGIGEADIVPIHAVC